MAAVILLFAGDIAFHYASLDWKYAPAKRRKNDGAQPTFFAFHVDPYYNFSEDFHLYYVRAKRIADRGWTDDLLYSRPDARPCYTAPIQVALTSVALLTDGRPLWYALYIFGILCLGWVTLLLAARCWLPKGIHSGSILFAVLATVLFEAIHYTVLAPRFPTFGIWPCFRGMRMATMAWTSPMLVAVMVGLAGLIFERRRWPATTAALALMLVLLLGSDNWAFALAWVATGLTISYISLTSILQYHRERCWTDASRQVVVALAIVMVATFAAHDFLSGALNGDSLSRAGFGPSWNEVNETDDGVPTMWQWFSAASVPVLFVWLLARVEMLPAGVKDCILLRKRDQSSGFWPQLVVLALLCWITAPVLYGVLKWGGAEPFLRYQLYWRANYCCVLPFFLILVEWLRTSLATLNFRAARNWTVAMTVIIGVFFVYHDHRVHWFVKYIGRKQFFLTADEERLRTWLKDFEREQGDFKLATLSPELNYLAAFWTNANLLLPSGFPYHDGASNEEIHERAVQLLRLYGATKKTWLDFTKPTSQSFCDIWSDSRVEAAGQGFNYYLFHRLFAFRRSGEERFNLLKRIEIGKELQAPCDVSLPRPEVILIDSVSKAVGKPDLQHYVQAFESKSIQAWVRADLSDRPAKTAATRTTRR